MKRHFQMMATYNAWANKRLYAMAVALSDDQYRRNVGVFFKSVHGTLNHLLVADRIWMHRLDRSGGHPASLNAIVCDQLSLLHAARKIEDQRIIDFINGLSDRDYDREWEYKTLNGTEYHQPLGDILAHVFNHQAHHRGQAHAALTFLGMSEPTPLDLLIMQREAQ